MRCAGAGRPGLPESNAALSRSTILSLVLMGAIGGLTLWALAAGEQVLSRPPAPVAALPEPIAFPGSSAARIFLSGEDSAEAARRGLLPPGTRSMLTTGDGLDYGEWRWDEAGVPAGPLAIRVDLTRQLVSVFRGRDEIGTAVIVYGIDGKETPRGRMPILGKARDHRSLTYDAPMPYSLWLREDGVALHGSTVRMGRATNGCIGVPVEFAARLFEVAEAGDVVEVVAAPKPG